MNFASSLFSAALSSSWGNAPPPPPTINKTVSEDSDPQTACIKRQKFIFIHGFMGSAESFKSFPVDLAQSFKSTFSGSTRGQETCVPEILHFEYDTTGLNESRVQQLADYLIQQSSTSSSPLIKDSSCLPELTLFAHSMGGILAMDAIIQLHMQGDLHSPSLPPSTKRSGKVHIPTLLTYDSPFFGLHSDVFLHGGRERAATVGKTVLNAAAMMSDILTSSTTAATGSAATVSESSSAALGKGGWGTMALAISSVAAFTAYASHPAVKSSVDNFVQAGVNEVRDRMEFLGPLWKVERQMERFEDWTRLGIAKRVRFRGFYLELDKPSLTGGKKRSFTQPYSVVGREGSEGPSSSWFEAIPFSRPRDEIEGHMHFFDPSCDAVAYGEVMMRTLAHLTTTT